MPKKSDCCKKYRKKARFCKKCPLRDLLGKSERRKLIEKAKKK